MLRFVDTISVNAEVRIWEVAVGKLGWVRKEDIDQEGANGQDGI